MEITEKTPGMNGYIKANGGVNGDITKTAVDFMEIELDPHKGNKEDEEEVDKFDIRNVDFSAMGPPWSEMTTRQKVGRVCMTIAGILFALGMLYIFICSLDILTSAFQLMAGRAASDAFANSVILNNPMAGLMIGVLATVLLQSSSTSTSIVVTLVGSGVLTVKQAIYIIMGANIGTSVTNTIVSLTQSVDQDIFRRSFAGATVHDMFNWLTVLILLPLEAASGYLYHLTKAIVKHIEPTDAKADEPEFLKVITNPLTKRIVKVDKKVLAAVAEDTDRAKYPLCQYYCETDYVTMYQSWPAGSENQTYIDEVEAKPWTVDITLTNDTEMTNLTWKDITNQSETCTHLFTGCGGVEGSACDLSDLAAGGILLACSIIILLASVIILVKILNLILRGPMAKAIRAGINADFPGKGKYFTGYVVMLIGAGCTMLVQSSSVFTSTITPLVGMGLISVERMFPLTLGANIGTCLTGILAALASDPSRIQNTMQVALAHLFFNITGILLFYPIPFMRNLPIKAAKHMGNTTAKYRWFAVAYVLSVFLLFPGAIFGLSLAGWKVLVGILVPIGAVIISIVVIKVMQHYCPLKMHPKMRDWKWLPKPLRSLEPCNKVVTRCCYNDACIRCRRKCACKKKEAPNDNDVERPPKYTEEVIRNDHYLDVDHMGQHNPTFEGDVNQMSSHTHL